MSPWRALLCLLLPPLAVLDRGCGMALIVGILWVAGGIPGIIAAFIINLLDPKPAAKTGDGHFVRIPVQRDADPEVVAEKPKRKGAFVRLADGEIAEVIEDDGQMPDTRKLRDE
ncbi:MAG: YqaE/Pmp3 family membrane protein [Anaerolineae bacterium]|nr:YqaE/Pmp3 family membrane protein [Anaerolineae bacterium]